MRSLFEKKPLILILAILALGALTVLSVSLRNVSFEAPQPIGREEAEPFSGSTQPLFSSESEEGGRLGILVWVVGGILLMLIGIMLSKEARKRMLRIIFRIAFTAWVLYFLLKRYPEMFSFLDFLQNQNAAATQNDEALADIPPPVFTPPQDASFLSYLVSVLVVLAILFLIWKLYRAWQSLNSGGARSLHEIAKVARASLRDLSDGRESTDVILNCYFRMSDVVADKKKLQREAAMTPGEFAQRLEQSGLPGDAVRRLTRLFERVRYGDQKAGPKETNEAVACLTTILQYCGEPV
ncbi:MAG TPA: DUF4129 domain-containing protein [Anaerolineales bacterium]|nr:DUF4129 domain-containing protein [Anaerolineales bacterium]